MSIIRSHHTTLHGGNDAYKIILRPLSDAHLPYLYKWNSDPEVLYWTEGDEAESYPPKWFTRFTAAYRKIIPASSLK